MRQQQETRTAWQLPPGVPRGTWDYAHSTGIARGYDAELATHPLFDLDAAVVDIYLNAPGVVVDLGCGTGRATIPLARHGHKVIAVDLSAEMLQIVGEKARRDGLQVDRVLANVVELDAIADGAADYALCLFSTLGMIRGHEHRQRAINHAFRILKPGGMFVVHVHNVWRNLCEPFGRRWLPGHVWECVRRRDVEWGDKSFDFHGVPQVFVHSFRRREFTGALRRAGFHLRELIAIDISGRTSVRWPWLAGPLRAYGWLAVCERPKVPTEGG